MGRNRRTMHKTYKTKLITTENMQRYTQSDKTYYTVSGKKVTPCVLFYNSGTGSRILTKFCANNTASNSKQTAKFQ